MNYYLKNLFQPLLWFISALVIGLVMITIGIPLTVGSLIWKRSWKVMPKLLINFIGQILLCITWLIGRVAITIDLIGNVCGYVFLFLITDKVTREHQNFQHRFGMFNMTISGSIGHLSLHNFLNKRGNWLLRILDEKIFIEEEEGHCINSYRYWIKKH